VPRAPRKNRDFANIARNAVQHAEMGLSGAASAAIRAIEKA
jgi:hypothetical protein